MNQEMGKWTKHNFLKRRNLNGQKTHEKTLTIYGHKGNVNQNYTYIPPHPLEYPASKIPTGVGEVVGK
jgi:hypothetical protein